MKDILTDRVYNNNQEQMQQISLTASSHTIHLSKYTSATNPERQISLGYKLKKYIQTHFSPPATTKKRVVTFFELAIFEMFSRLRNQLMKNNPLVPSSEIEKNVTSLDFKWLHPLEFRKSFASCILRMENSFSKQRIYLLDAEDYYHFKPDWDFAINSQSKDFKTFVLLYNQKEDLPQNVCPSTNGQDGLQEFFQSHHKEDTVHIPKYKKSDFVSYTIQSRTVQSQIFNHPKTTREDHDTFLTKLDKFRLERDQQMKFFFVTRIQMSKYLENYYETLILVLNDMIKFVGYEEPVRFEGNYQTNQARWCVRNNHTIAFNSLKIKGRQFQNNRYDEDQANRFLYTTDAPYENMLAFISYGEQSKVEVIYGYQVDQKARKMMLQVVDVSDPISIQQTTKKLKKMDDISVFKYCIIFAKKTGNFFTIKTQDLQEFIEKCEDEYSGERKCLMNYINFNSAKNPTFSRDINIADTGAIVKETCYRSNFMQLTIAAEMWRRKEKAKRQEKKKKPKKWNLGDFKLPK